MNSCTHLLLTAFAMIFLGSTLLAQVTLRRDATVYHGSAANSTAPAIVDAKELRSATPEWQKIVVEGIDVSSARGRQILQRMSARIREAVKSVASAEARDLVVRSKDIADDRGREVRDLTDQVVAELEE